MKGIVKLGVTLFLICSIAAGSLAFVAEFTREPIAEQARREQQEALQLVAPRATKFAETAGGQWDATGSEGTIGTVRATTAKGYGGPISLVLGLDLEGKVTGVRVLRQSETPGLGTKVADDAFLGQFIGKPADQLRLRKDAAGGTIDAVAAATISSRAVTEALRSAAGGE